jgi:hypothetical protein
MSSGIRPFDQVIIDGLRGRPSRALHPIKVAEDVVSWIFGEKTHLPSDLIPVQQQWHTRVHTAPPPGNTFPKE